MWQVGEYVAIREHGSSVLNVAVIDRVTRNVAHIGERAFSAVGAQMTRSLVGAIILRLTPERESAISLRLPLPEIGSDWQHENGIYTVTDHTNVGSDKPMFPQTVVYVGKANGKKWSRSVARWHSGKFRLLVKPAKCQGTQFSDMMRCEACRMSWDTNDSDPPLCPVTGDRARACGRPGP